jgi:hypothetical protein
MLRFWPLALSALQIVMPMLLQSAARLFVFFIVAIISQRLI